MIRSTTTRLIGTKKVTRGSFPILRSDDGYGRDLDHDLRNGERRRGQQCAGREFLSVDFLANIGEALRVASVRNRDGHPDYVLECAAGALEGLLEILESLASLSVEVAGERSSAIVDEPDMAGQPYRLPALRDDRGREGVFRFPRGLDDCFLECHFNLLLARESPGRAHKCSRLGSKS